LKVKFTPYVGDLIGLSVNEHYLIFRWIEPDCKVLFSVCRLGDAANIHLASDKKGLRKLRQASNDFCEFVFWLFDWAKMILCKITVKSVEKIAKDCGFVQIAKRNNVTVFMRCR
jgi:hypothetical protein